jgi:DNA-binding SARP family transcriptional activator
VLEVSLFGGFDVRSDGVRVVLASTRAQSLLAYLVLQRGASQRRDHLAFLLWPESSEQQARTNLRHVLHTLRATVPDVERYLQTTTGTLSWHGAWADVAAFEAAIARAATEDDGETAVRALREAVDLYSGDLLEGWYDDWLVPERDHFRGRTLAALTRLGSLLEARGDLDAAVTCGERARTVDRLDEGSYRSLMRLHDARGDRARAVRVYHECVATLQEELGVEPSPETLAVYEALLPGAGGAPRTSGIGPLVGRRPERGRLTSSWRDACSGRAQLVVLTGEPGIGKTRLVDEFRHWVSHQGGVTASARSYEVEGTLAYAPVVEWLRDPALARRRGLDAAHLAALGRLLPELTPDPTPEEPQSRLQLFDAAAHALVVGGDPVLLVADDLHAADSQTLQFLHYLLRAEPRAPLLVVATARPADTDADHPLHALVAGLRALDRCTELELRRLERAETAVLADRLGSGLSPSDVDRLHAETEGNPLFIVESLRAGWPDGDRSDVLTPKVQAVLEARLRQLTPGARDLLGVAAAAGSSVSVEVLTLSRPAGEAQVTRDLDELWRRQLLLAAGGDIYDFSHDKLREVAYRGLSPAQRRHHHRTLARAMEEAYRDRLDAVAGQIAAHLDSAGADEDAVGWYLRAAAAAQHLYAEADAARLFERAWEIIRSQPTSREQQERELEILTKLPGPLAAADGYASERLRSLLDRAFEISRLLGEEPAAPLLRARAMAVLSRSDFDAALEYGSELRARGEHDDVLAVEGDFVRGVAASWRGEPVLARTYLEAAVSRYRPENRTAHLLSFAQDPLVLCLVRLAHLHVRLGEPKEAERLRDRSLELARTVGHPFTLATVLVFASLTDLDLADLDLADLDPAHLDLVDRDAQDVGPADLSWLRERVTELDGLRDRIDAPPLRLSAAALQALLDVVDGRTAQGLARIDAALADPGRLTAPGLTAMLLRIRLAACEHAGQVDGARATAQRLLDADVRTWDDRARAVLAAQR